MMRELPILFTTEMVQAILGGQKTQTRRVMNPQVLVPAKMKYEAGDLLYVRETFAYLKPMTKHHAPRQNVVFKTGGGGELVNWDKGAFEDGKWRPNIHMPKVFSRIWLKATKVRIERIQDITERDCIGEGIGLRMEDYLWWKRDRMSSEAFYGFDVMKRFRELWDSINADRTVDVNIAGWDTKLLCGWEQDPLVWAIDFERVDR